MTERQDGEGIMAKYIRRLIRIHTVCLLYFLQTGNMNASEIEKGTHIFALIQSAQRCPDMNAWENKFVGIRIYRSISGNYFTYFFENIGTEFGPNGGSALDEFDGGQLRSELRFIKEKLRYSLTYKKSFVKVIFSTELEIASKACLVLSCKISTIPLPNGCVSKCQPESCEVRRGPAS